MVNFQRISDKARAHLRDRMGMYIKEIGKPIFPKVLGSKNMQTETNTKEHFKMA